MKVFRGIDELAPGASRTAITIGNFDGVHRGHAAIIKRVLRLSAELNAVPTVLTFDPHPQQVLHGSSPEALVTLERKLELLSDAGIEQTVVMPFSKELSLVEPETFIEEFLVGRLHSAAVVVGVNFRFGRFARGDTTMLRSFGKDLGYTTEGVRLAELEGRRVSSTEIRHAITGGQIDWANKALGRPHRIPGRIVGGHGRGKPMGFPTANLEPPRGFCIPLIGIYAGYLVREQQAHAAAISVGTNPTFGSGPVSIEAFVLDFDGDIYGSAVAFDFVTYLRPEERFSNHEDLARAIARDVEQARKILGV